MTTTLQKLPSANESAQYLTFTLDGEFFATEIAQVREVLEFKSITKVPRTPDYMRGVINLRGSVVPVLDLRLQLGMGATEPAIDTCIVIVEVPIDGQLVVLGALADSVQEVLEMRVDQLAPPPRLGTRIRTDFIRAMGRQTEQFMIIVDMERVFCSETMAAIRDIPQQLAQAGVDKNATLNDRAACSDELSPAARSPVKTNEDFEPRGQGHSGKPEAYFLGKGSGQSGTERFELELGQDHESDQGICVTEKGV